MPKDALGKVYADGEIVVRQGDAGDCMFAVQAGRLEVVRETAADDVLVGLLEEGDIFGEMAIFEKQARSATVRALGEVRVLTIDKKTFLARVQDDPSIALNIAKLLCSRVRRLNAEIEKLNATFHGPGVDFVAP